MKLHSEAENVSQCDNRYKNEAISCKCVEEDLSVTSNCAILNKVEKKNNEIIDLLAVAIIVILFGQLTTVILEKLSLISYVGVRWAVQAALFIFATVMLNSKYPLDMRQFDIRLLFKFALVGIILCFIRFIPFFISLSTRPRFTDDYLIYANLSGLHYLWALVLLIIIGPFSEELLFRGYLFRLLSNRTNMTVAAIISSIIFAAIHGIQSGWIMNHFLLGIFCCYVYSKSNCIWSSIITHIGNNAIWYFCTGYLSNKF